MADFSSDTDNSAVEELISQARDLCVLEQLASINSSGLSDSPLPPDLDSRFRRLKTFPRVKPSSRSSDPRRQAPASTTPTKATCGEGKSESSPASGYGKRSPQQSPSRSISSSLESPKFDEVKRRSSKSKSKAEGKSRKSNVIEKKRKPRTLTPSESSNSSLEDDDILYPSELNMQEKPRSKSKSKQSPLSSLGSSRSWMNSSSPPQRTGCFWCSPKKDSTKRKTHENRAKGTSFDWSQQDDILSDLGIFSKKEQQNMMKKAMKEEEKISREAEKIVQMAKQASARMTATGIEDELSDDDSPKHI